MIRQLEYIPEIHDVSSADIGALGAMLALLPTSAREVAPLLVVPRWCGVRSIVDCPTLLAQLKDLPGEKVLHGYTHSLGPSLWDRVAFGTDNESEFAGCTRAEALERLRAGTELFTEAFGHPPRWFCAPRWYQGRETTLALQQLGIRGQMLRSEFDVAGTRLPIEAIWFDDGSRTVTRSLARHVRTRRIRHILDEQAPFRLVLHPRDLWFTETRHEIRELVTQLTGNGWRPVPLPALDAA